jgi:hypothetical protein
MKSKHAVLTAAFIASLIVIAPVNAQVGKGLSGPHYNLNIIGVPKDKTADMTGGNGHRIFVPLNTNGEVPRDVKIYYERNVDDPDKFVVKDANATDDNEATVLVPYEYCEDESAGCMDLLSFDVYSVGLGKPNGKARITVNCDFDGELVGGDGSECEAAEMGSFKIKRKRGKPKPVEITDVFRATGCLDTDEIGDDGYGVCDEGELEFNNVWIFNLKALLEYYWDYDNNGLKLMQTRFYPTTSGCIKLVGGGTDCSGS